MPILANFDETKQSQLQLVELLINMGYEYIPAEQVMKQRGGDKTKFILRDIALESLNRINSYSHKGQNFKFGTQNVVKAVDELENTPMIGLIDTSREIYNMIRSNSTSRTLKEYVGGKYGEFDFKFIDYTDVSNNHFGVTVEYMAEGKAGIRCDVVLFVNGLPLVIIENKKSAVEIKQAIDQLCRYQSSDYCPRLFCFSQLVIATNKTQWQYGTTGTGAKFFSPWKEKDTDMQVIDSYLNQLIAKPISPQIYDVLLKDLNGATGGHNQMLERMISEQDRGAYYLLRHERLLDLVQNHILYDGGTKKISRYQQYFAIHKIMARVEQTENGKRAGGLVWHTQGSGKSLTMVTFVKALIENPKILNPRIIIVTDRKDLDKQIKDTFVACKLKKEVQMATSGSDLIKMIQHKSNKVITTLVHKFESAKKNSKDFVDPDPNIFVLVDEAHRTQGGMANLEMGRLLPNACFIGFTGTPLMKTDKASINKFGGYIDKYTIDDALADGVVLPLIYEGRYVAMAQDKAQIDRQVERMNLNQEQNKIMQRETSQKVIKSNPSRIREIAYDVSQHFITNLQGTGLKGQLVAPSKYAAVLFQKYFKEMGEIETALVISDTIYSQDEDDIQKKEVEGFLKEIKDKYQSIESYEKEVIASFVKQDDGIEIIIVVDKLLTGFDAPRNTALYLAKDLKDHNLLQAIARVNRLFDNPSSPKHSGFIIDYSQNARNLKSAMELFGNYDNADIQNALIDVKDKISELETSYSDVVERFKKIKNKTDDQEYLELLDLEDERKLFYNDLNRFIKVFGECMSFRDFGTNFENVDVYKQELKKLLNIRKTISLKYADNKDFLEYKTTLLRILSENIKAEEVELLTKPININDSEAFSKAIDSLHSNKSKAEAISAQLEKVITEKVETDPGFYGKFSIKIEEILQRMNDSRLSDLETLNELKILQDKILSKTDDTQPIEIKQNQGASLFYRNFEKVELAFNSDQGATIAIGINNIFQENTTIDWHKNTEKKRIIKNKIDDYLYDELARQPTFDNSNLAKIIDKIVELAVLNPNIWN
jgi:type I restriction enzyme, R subunit